MINILQGHSHGLTLFNYSGTLQSAHKNALESCSFNYDSVLLFVRCKMLFASFLWCLFLFSFYMLATRIMSPHVGYFKYKQSLSKCRRRYQMQVKPPPQKTDAGNKAVIGITICSVTPAGGSLLSSKS